MPFLIIGGVTVEVLHDGAVQRPSEKMGETVRAAAGNMVSTVRFAKRIWEFDTGPLLPAQEEELRTLVDADTPVLVAGDAITGNTPFCIVDIGDTTYVSDGTVDGFYRFAHLTITEI